MIKTTLNAIFNLFDSDKDCTEEELFKETSLMVLSRATNADSNIIPAEVKVVVEMIDTITGEEVSEADVRVAGQSHLYESAPLESYVERVSTKLSIERRVTIAKALARVVVADERVTKREVSFYNMVCSALKLRPSDLVGLIPTQSH